jgi:hypothetical protein
MARRPALIKSKPKTQRKTHSEVYLVNRKYLGDEPTNIKSRIDIINATNWYGMMCDKDDAREYLTTWLTEQKRTDLAKRVKSIPDTWVPLHIAWQCRIASRNVIDTDTVRMFKDIEYAISKATKEEPTEKPKVAAPSIQDRMRDKLSDIIGEIEALIDSGETFSLYDWLKKNEIPAMYASKIGDYYGPIWNEFVQAHSGKLDGYENWTKAKLKQRMDFYNNIVSDAERYGDVTKKIRKPRKARPVSTEKLLKYFTYQKESNDYKLASVNPETILGAQELWCFNTKYKTVTVFRALDRSGLTVKRSSITNFDEKSSLTKGTGRQVEKVLDKLQNGGKIVLRKLMDELKTAKPLQERINENTILIKVVK